MTVGDLVAALWSMRRDIEVTILFDGRLYDITRVVFESDLAEKGERSVVLLRTGSQEEKADDESN